MNFTSEIKRDFASLPAGARGQDVATFAALITTGGTRTEQGFEFVSENERVAAYFMELCERNFGVRPELKEATFDPKRERDKLTFACVGDKAAEILHEVGAVEIGRLKGESALSYIRGAFLGGGSCTLPRGGAKTGYHLEFVLPDAKTANAFVRLLDKSGLIARKVIRGETAVVSLKSREAISDFLSVSGAASALRTLEEVSAAREERNQENRVSNCYAGNADKSAIASATQVMVLRKLEQSGGLSALDDTLIQTAHARLEHPELSLTELAQLIGVTKSALNHRMRKLMKIYDTDKEHD